MPTSFIPMHCLQARIRLASWSWQRWRSSRAVIVGPISPSVTVQQAEYATTANAGSDTKPTAKRIFASRQNGPHCFSDRRLTVCCGVCPPRAAPSDRAATLADPTRDGMSSGSAVGRDPAAILASRDHRAFKREHLRFRRWRVKRARSRRCVDHRATFVVVGCHSGWAKVC